MKGSCLVVLLVGCLALTLLTPSAGAQDRRLVQQTQYQGREIGNLTGDVYYARQDDYVSVFMVTPDGIILVEPIGLDMARWLKGELTERFDVPVKYVIYSHHHYDHGSGAAIWADTARLIGHENMIGHLEMPPANTALPERFREQDANGNGRLEYTEAMGNLGRQFDLYDDNEDGVLSGAEVTRGPFKNVVPPDLTYTEPLNIRLGGKLVEVIPFPVAHADDNTIVRFVDGTNVLFASDWVTIDRTPFGPAVSTASEIELVKQVAAMDFDHFICSHGKLGRHEDFTNNLEYREEVRAQVAAAIAAGQSLDEARESIRLEDYDHWEFFAAQRPQNIAGAYRELSGN